MGATRCVAAPQCSLVLFLQNRIIWSARSHFWTRECCRVWCHGAPILGCEYDAQQPPIALPPSSREARLTPSQSRWTSSLLKWWIIWNLIKFKSRDKNDTTKICKWGGYLFIRWMKWRKWKSGWIISKNRKNRGKVRRSKNFNRRKNK